MFRRILIAVDESEPAQRATTIGGQLALATGAQAKLVHVVHPPAPFIAEVPPVETDLEERGRVLLTKLRSQLPAAVTADDELREGRPSEQIVVAASEWNADLIVVGDHNRHALSRFLLGSTSDAVVRHAPCSVLVARRPDASMPS